MFKLEVHKAPTNAQRNDILIKEISFLTSMTVAFIFFILLSVLLCVSKYRRRTKNLNNLNEKETDEMSAVLGRTICTTITQLYQDFVQMQRWRPQHCCTLSHSPPPGGPVRDSTPLLPWSSSHSSLQNGKSSPLPH